MERTPTYRALADRLMDGLDDYASGDRLPSENELQERFGVSRITTRSALQELERRHLVRRTRGSGTYAALRLPYPISADMAPSWSGHVRRAGHEPSHETLEATTHRVSAFESDRLELPRRRTVTRLNRLGRIDGLPASVHRSLVPLDLAPDLADNPTINDSLTRTLIDHYELDVTRRWSRAELASVPADVAELVELSPGDMAWLIESVNACRRRNRPVEYARSWMRADCFRVSLEFETNSRGTQTKGRKQ